MQPVLAFLSGGEWAIVLLLVVLFFGAAKIPQLARSLGKAKGEFEKGARESRDAASAPETEEEKVLRAARELGIPTEGRPLADVKQDVRAKLN